MFAQSDSDSDWRGHFASCVQSALVDALAERTESFFRNEVFAFIGSPLVGEYRFGGYRLVQVTPVDPAVRIPVEHAVVLSFSVQAPDRVRADLLSHARAEDFMAVLGALLGVGFYRFRHQRFWGVTSDGQALRARHAFEPLSLLRIAIRIFSIEVGLLRRQVDTVADRERSRLPRAAGVLPLLFTGQPRVQPRRHWRISLSLPVGKPPCLPIPGAPA